jgi:hypothetical protein
MSLRTRLKADVAHAEHQIADDKHAITTWDKQLAALSVPSPRAGVDYYAAEGVNLQALKAKGVTFICRYLGEPASKVLDAAEANAITKAGMDIVTVWETEAERVLEDYGAGEADARDAKAQLHAAGAPDTSVAYFAVDFEAEPSQYLRILGYFQGAQKVLGADRVGVYGGYGIVHELLTNNHVRFGWQTLAWSKGLWSPHAQLRQIEIETYLAGVHCDLDRSATASFGQWRR